MRDDDKQVPHYNIAYQVTYNITSEKDGMANNTCGHKYTLLFLTKFLDKQADLNAQCQNTSKRSFFLNMFTMIQVRDHKNMFIMIQVRDHKKHVYNDTSKRS